MTRGKIREQTLKNAKGDCFAARFMPETLGWTCTATTEGDCRYCAFYKPLMQAAEERQKINGTTDIEEICAYGRLRTKPGRDTDSD